MPQPCPKNKQLKLQRVLMTFNSLLKNVEGKLKSRQSKNNVHKDLPVERRCWGGGELGGRGPHE